MALWLGVAGVASSGINVNPTSARYSGITATGVRDTVTYEAAFTGSVNGVRNYAVPVAIESATIGTLAKGALRRGLGWYGVALTIKDLVNGAGWLIDELKRQVVTPDTRTTLPPGSYAYCSSSGKTAGQCSASAEGLCAAYGFEAVDAGGGVYLCRGTNSDIASITRRLLSTATVDVGSGSQSREVTDTELGDVLKASPQVINAILIDPETGAPIRTKEITDAMNALRKQLEAANGVDPGPDATPTPDTSETQPMESEWPTFCGWAGKVCDFIDWVRSDGEAEKELPEQEIDINPNGWSSGISGGSCPAAETFTVNVAGSQGQGEFSWQPLCDFSTLLRPFLIAVASVAAVMILAGLRSSTAK
ncbi:hypothetical protein ISN35_15310 [Xanthomonas translucens pv. undulosa]|uniref:virulence factor TspB C-terminal domain-related protein n=1 Tax=Xanthomonas campestris pv. translucens TaxID=343 RepID=UPI0019D59E1A|nr:virulence factor TspB C-terminal domain-related protein [Xanthomonas translucens]QSQ40421.1 hypothetical protein ISN33_12125 [Xanthomonas translucens pv. translucens]QSQ48382.1 hypothetical protein ISN35_15310 [Xanthomonas translucens pv. undulosa]